MGCVELFFEIYEDEDEIPDEIIELFLTPPREMPLMLYCGEEMSNKLNEACKDYIKEAAFRDQYGEITSN